MLTTNVKIHAIVCVQMVLCEDLSKTEMHHCCLCFGKTDTKLRSHLNWENSKEQSSLSLS